MARGRACVVATNSSAMAGLEKARLYKKHPVPPGPLRATGGGCLPAGGMRNPRRARNGCRETEVASQKAEAGRGKRHITNSYEVLTAPRPAPRVPREENEASPGFQRSAARMKHVHGHERPPFAPGGRGSFFRRAVRLPAPPLSATKNPCPRDARTGARDGPDQRSGQAALTSAG